MLWPHRPRVGARGLALARPRAARPRAEIFLRVTGGCSAELVLRLSVCLSVCLFVCRTDPGHFPLFCTLNFASFGRTDGKSGLFAPTGVGIRSSTDDESKEKEMSSKKIVSSSVRHF